MPFPLDFMILSFGSFLFRYGGATFGEELNNASRDSFHPTVQKLKATLGPHQSAKIWYNFKGYHAMPAFINLMNNAILKANLENGEKKYGSHFIIMCVFYSMYVYFCLFIISLLGVLVCTDTKQFVVINFQFITVIPCKVTVTVKSEMQKQPCRHIFKQRYSGNMQQIYRRTPMPKCDFNKVVLHDCSPVNLLFIYFFIRTPLEGYF